MKLVRALAAAGLVGFFGRAAAQEVNWHGFVLANYSLRTAKAAPDPAFGDFLLADQRLQLKLSAAEGEGRAFAKLDFFQDALTSESELELREAFLDYRLGSLDFRAGRQIVTWGLGDLLFVNDLFPKDWQALFSGRPVEYLKIGVDGLKTTFSSPLFSAELTAIPFFQPDRLPTPDRFFLYDPFTLIPTRTETKPAPQFENLEVAGRLYRNVEGIELALYAYRGFFKSPGARADSVSVGYFYPKLAVYGASAQRSVYSGVLSLEYGFYDSRQDRRGDDPSIANTSHRFLAGYQRQGWTDFTYTFQFYGEVMLDYDVYKSALPAGFPKQGRFRQMVALRATQWLKYQTLKLSGFGFYSPSDKDFYLLPEIQYKLSDKLGVIVGGNLFGGEKNTTFWGQFDQNDNVYSSLRFDF